jgi:hypothetical protein
MGNCNFQAEVENENLTGIHPLCFFPILTVFSNRVKRINRKEQLYLSLPYWQRRLRKSMESRTQKGQAIVCNEGNV